MVVEKFRNGDAAPVNCRFRERGRMAPAGLTYILSWVDVNLATCYQVMSVDDLTPPAEWMGHWADLTEFEVYPEMTSEEAAPRMALKAQA